jgi:glucoamylase
MKVLSVLLVGLFASQMATADDFENKMNQQFVRAADFMKANISRSDGAAGSVVASPSRRDPDYYYHWVRDGALVMDSLETLMFKTSNGDEKYKIRSTLKDFTHLSRKMQVTETVGHALGEPKFYLNGSGFFGPWGRPQNDGPALRSITLIRFAQMLIKENEIDFVKAYLYEATIPAYTVIKSDLEYVAHHWQDSSFDVWEEIKGDHFYNRLVSRRSLMMGADLADQMNDHDAAKFYREQADRIRGELYRFFDSNRSYIVATLNRTDGADYKDSQIDSVVILGILHGMQADGLFSPSDERVMATAQQIIRTFHELYTINKRSNAPGTGIGRYPEDRYDGMGISTVGNPWFLTTHGMAEYFYRLGADIRNKGSLKITPLNLPLLQSLKLPSSVALSIGKTLKASDLSSALKARGDDFMMRAFTHMNQDTGQMSEQFNRYSGYMQGAHDLTWSYASFLTAYWARQEM